MIKQAFLLLLISGFFYSCTKRVLVNVEKPQGERVSISLEGSPGKIDGELLSVTDSVLFLLSGAKYFRISFSNIKSVHVQGFRIPLEGKVPPMLMLIVMDFSSIPLFQNTPALAYSFGALIPLTIYAFLHSGPKVKFSPPLDAEETEKLSLYSRYPQGLSAEQWTELLDFYKQEDFKKIPSGPK